MKDHKRAIWGGIGGLLLFSLLQWPWWPTFAAAQFVYYLVLFVSRLRSHFAFREFIMLLFAVNFLLAPAILYNELADYQNYPLVIPQEQFFALTMPALVLFQLGLYCIPTRIFQPDVQLMKVGLVGNRNIMLMFVVIGFGYNLFYSIIPSSLNFIFYSLSYLRYIGAIGLYISNKRKYAFLLLLLLGMELYWAMGGMFTDIVIWSIFSGMLLCYLLKPKVMTIGIVSIILLTGVYLIQIAKSDFRAMTWSTGTIGSVDIYTGVMESNLSSEELGSKQQVADVLSRMNQGWIFSHVVRHIDNNQDYAGMELINKYLVFIFIPRFLAPDKIKSGSGMQDIFMQYTDYQLSGSTSMGMGFFADGYIASGWWGLLIMAFVCGALFSIVFKIVEGWAARAEIYILFILPMLTAASRPDCETPTALGNMIKSIVIFWAVIQLYQRYFEKQLSSSKHLLSGRPSASPTTPDRRGLSAAHT